MRIRWRFALPIVGLLLFAGVTYNSLRVNREAKSATGRYFWWSSIHLDSDPLNRQPSTPCKAASLDCANWGPGYISVDPGWLTKLLAFSAFPAFLIEAIILGGLRRLGINEVTTFMVSMPVLIAAWYYFAGRLLDRWVKKLSRQPHPSMGNG
jgi:hypothetical protein